MELSAFIPKVRRIFVSPSITHTITKSLELPKIDELINDHYVLFFECIKNRLNKNKIKYKKGMITWKKNIIQRGFNPIINQKSLNFHSFC